MSKVKEYLKENWAVLAVFAVLSVLEIAVIFPLMYEDYINYDSSYQYALTQHSIPEIIELLPYDYSPPFYALALKLYTMIFGNTLRVMRSFSIFAVVGMMFVGAFPVKAAFGKRSAVLCMIITFCSCALLKQLPEIRPTIFAMFFMMAVSAYAVAAYGLEKRYAYICFTAFAVLAMYTNNISLVGTFAVYVVLLIFCLVGKDLRKFRNFLISGAISAVLYLPWLGVLLSQVSHVNEHFWEVKTGFGRVLSWVFSDPFETYSPAGWLSLAGRTIFLFILIGFFLIFLKHINFKKLRGAGKISEVIRLPVEKPVYVNIFMIFAFIFAAVFIMHLVNTFLKNIASERYYYILGMMWIVLLSAIMGQFGNKIYNLIFSLMLAALNIINIQLVKNDLSNSNFHNIMYIADNYEDELCFLHLHEWSLGTLSYYFPEATHYVCDETFTVLRSFDVFPMTVVNIGDKNNIWNYTDKCYVFTNTDFMDPDGEIKYVENILRDIDDSEMTYIDTYVMGYPCASKKFEMAELKHTTSETDTPGQPDT